MNNLPISTSHTAIYCRKSEESEERQVLSLSSQREEALKLASVHSILHTTVYEESKSAKVSGRRLVFGKMVKDIKKGKIHAIICWKLDRLARNMIEGGEIIDLLQRGALKAIITPSKTYYPNENALLMAVEFGAANQYSRDLSQNVKRGQRKKAELGFPHGIAPIGFLNTKSTAKGENAWVVDKERFPVIKEIFAMYLSGNHTGNDIYTWARYTANLRTQKRKKSGNQPVSRSAIYRMLSNPVYSGFFILQGETYILNKSLPRVITPRQHEEIVTKLFSKTSTKRQKHDVLYRGYIVSEFNEFVGADVKLQVRCDCGFKFSYVNKIECPKCRVLLSKMKRSKYLQYVYYRNGVKAKRGESVTCISEDEITKYLLEYVEKYLLLSDNLSDWCIKYLSESQDKMIEQQVIAANNRDNRIKELNDRKVKYRMKVVDGVISESEYLNDIAKINIELAQLDITPDTQLLLDKAKDVFRVGKEFLEVFKNGTVERKRKMLSKLGSNLVWDEKKLSIINTPWIQSVINGLNEAKSKNKEFEPKNSLAEQDQTGVFQFVSPILLRACDKVRNVLLKKSDS